MMKLKMLEIILVIFYLKKKKREVNRVTGDIDDWIKEHPEAPKSEIEKLRNKLKN